MTFCSVDGCKRKSRKRGWCEIHYARWHRHGDPIAGGTTRGEPEKFLQIALAFRGIECLLWPFNCDSGGYGQLRVDGKMRLAHRIACESLHGPAPSAEHECAHSCGRGHMGCVNPTHLRWATPGENQADRLHHGTRKTKLADGDVLTIRADNRAQRIIARDYGVGQTTIGQIKRGQRWKHLAPVGTVP